MRGTKQPFPQFVLVMAGGVCALLGLLTVIGWNLNLVSLIQLGLGFRLFLTMARIALFLAGTGLLGLGADRLKLARVLGVAVMLFVAAGVGESFASMQLGGGISEQARRGGADVPFDTAMFSALLLRVDERKGIGKSRYDYL